VLVTDAIQQALGEQDLTPATHLVDSGYLDTETLPTSAERGIRIVGPLQRGTSWQERAGGRIRPGGLYAGLGGQGGDLSAGQAEQQLASHHHPQR